MPGRRKRHRRNRKRAALRSRRVPYSVPSRTIGRLSEGSTYKFKRTLLYQVISPTMAPLATFGGMAFRFSDMPNFAEFTVLYDQYKITGVKLMFIPQMTDNTSATQNVGTFMYFYDYDDSSSAGLSLDTFYQKMNLKMRQAANRPFKLFFRPKAGIAGVQSVSGNQVASLPRSTWLDCASPDAFYYGLKWAWSNVNITTPSLLVYATYYFTMKGVQ